MGRLFALLMALLGGAALSQAPEFAQQYMQRLAGEVNALREYVVEPIDDDAAAAGLTRREALAGLAASEAGEFPNLLSGTLQDMLARYEALDAHLLALRRADEYERSWLIARQRDVALLRDTAEDYRPAMPLTLAGVVHAGAGFVIGWILGAFVAGLLGLFFPPARRRRAYARQAR
jgi:hypothetical protein